MPGQERTAVKARLRQPAAGYVVVTRRARFRSFDGRRNEFADTRYRGPVPVIMAVWAFVVVTASPGLVASAV